MKLIFEDFYRTFFSIDFESNTDFVDNLSEMMEVYFGTLTNHTLSFPLEIRTVDTQYQYNLTRIYHPRPST